MRCWTDAGRPRRWVRPDARSSVPLSKDEERILSEIEEQLEDGATLAEVAEDLDLDLSDCH